MPLKFPKAPRVAVGTPPTSRDMIALANAWNARERSGLGDFSWRACMMWLNAFRQVRMPEDDLFPSMAEFFFLYQLLDPENDVGTWPVADVGDPQGANPFSPMNAYIFGIDVVEFPSEEQRLEYLDLWNNIRPPSTPEEWWNLHKLQCGVIDPDTGAQSAPAIETARATQLITFTGQRVPYGQTYGGFFPAPVELLSACGPTEDRGLTQPSYEIKFTALTDNPSTTGVHGSVSVVDGRNVITYAGSCPYNTDYTADGHVQTVLRYPFAYYVGVLYGGAIVWDILPTVDWLEGPYTGNGKLARYAYDVFGLANWVLTNGFRGTDAQREKGFDIRKLAFDFERFHTEQHLLAPQIGVESPLGISPAYATAKLTTASDSPAGTILKFGSQAKHTYREGYVFTGYFAKATNLFTSVTLEIATKKKTLATITLTPEEPAVLKFLDKSVVPDGPVFVRLASRARFTSPGEIRVELTEQFPYTPDELDAGLMLRLAATRGGFEGEGSFLDGSGFDCLRAKEIFDQYRQFGSIVNTVAAGVRTQGAAVNVNPVFDAMRRFSREMMRCVRADEYLSIEKVANGNVKLRFKRYAFGQKNTKADIFYGIAPSYRTVPEIVEGVEYIVRSHTGGAITYNGARMVHGMRFIGGKKSTYDVQGDALCLEYQGIKPNAPKGGTSNEWLMFIETFVYHQSGSSLWKRDAYEGFFASNNRCHFYAYDLPGELARMADLPSGLGPANLHLSPEAPSGYNYTLGANASASEDFCRSCQVYKAPYEILGATVEFDANGYDIVELTVSPLQRHADEAATFSRDPLTWDASAIQAESYRTDSNALREYRLLMDRGIHASWKTGDGAAENYVQGLPDNPHGSAIPRFWLSSLIKKPPEDGNDTQTKGDSLIVIEELRKLWVKIKAGSEGCVNGNSTQAYACAAGLGLPYDYLFEDLVFDATGKRGIYDFKGGFGPQVNTKLRASVFNDLAACVDLMHKFRLDGTMELQARKTTFNGTANIAADFVLCGGTGSFQGSAAAAYSSSSTSAWGPPAFDSVDVNSGAALTPCGTDGTSIGMTFYREKAEFRVVVSDALNFALSSSLRDLVEGGQFNVYGKLCQYSFSPNKTDADDPINCEDFTNHFGSSGKSNPPNCQFETQGGDCYVISGAEGLEVGDPPGGAFYVCSYPDASSGSGISTLANNSGEAKIFSITSQANSTVIVVPVV